MAYPTPYLSRIGKYMSLFLWIIIYCINALIWKWIISWGGAAQLQNWWGFLFTGWMGNIELNSEQIRAFALLCWIGFTIWFVIGIFIPEVRLFKIANF